MRLLPDMADNSSSLCPTYHEPFEVTLHPHAIFKKKIHLNIDLPPTPVRMYACIHLSSQTFFALIYHMFMRDYMLSHLDAIDLMAQIIFGDAYV